MPWEKGESGNPGGRPKKDAEIRLLARSHGINAIEKLVELMNNGDPRIQFSAAKAILDRGFGRPAQSTNINTPHKTHEERLEELADYPVE